MTTANCCASEINTTVSGLLGLVGVEADPTKSREAIFRTAVIQHAWENGHDLELGSLIQEIQSPGVQRIGVMDVETFYPARRFTLATAINGLLASPGFGAWLEGEPLDIQRIYYTEAGKPRVAIFPCASQRRGADVFRDATAESTAGLDAHAIGHDEFCARCCIWMKFLVTSHLWRTRRRSGHC